MSLPVTTRKKFIKKFNLQGLRDSEVVCFPFWELSIAMGCPFPCSYCFLQYSPYFNFNKDALLGQIYDNADELEEELRKWCLKHPTPQGMIVGELQDGMAFDEAYHQQDGVAMSERIHRVMKDFPQHLVVILTKSTTHQHFLKLDPIPNMIMSWSMTTKAIWEAFETKGSDHPTAHPYERTAKAEECAKAGWRIRFRISPMLPHGDWRTEYKELFQEMDKSNPELVTANGLLAQSKNTGKRAAERNGRDGSVFDLLEHNDGKKWRLKPEDHMELLKMVEQHFGRKAALCKEKMSVWQELGFKWDGCHCLNTKGDDVVVPRWKEIKAARRKEAEHGQKDQD